MGAPAGGAGDHPHPLLTDPQGLEDVPGGPHLLHRVVGEGDADGVADAVAEEGADADGRLDEAHPLGPRLGDPQVEGSRK